MENQNFGMRVVIIFSDSRSEILRNVTEIHYKYPTPEGKRVAFESDIHHTGITYPLEFISEFETNLETFKAPEF